MIHLVISYISVNIFDFFLTYLFFPLIKITLYFKSITFPSARKTVILGKRFSYVVSQ